MHRCSPLACAALTTPRVSSKLSGCVGAASSAGCSTSSSSSEAVAVRTGRACSAAISPLAEGLRKRLAAPGDRSNCAELPNATDFDSEPSLDSDGRADVIWPAGVGCCRAKWLSESRASSVLLAWLLRVPSLGDLVALLPALARPLVAEAACSRMAACTRRRWISSSASISAALRPERQKVNFASRALNETPCGSAAENGAPFTSAEEPETPALPDFALARTDKYSGN